MRIDSWLALGVFLSIAATDAVYVPFNAAVSSPTTSTRGYMEQRVASQKIEDWFTVTEGPEENALRDENDDIIRAEVLGL